MSLIRCPGCKLDTSDSLAHCPSCGTALHGSGPKLFEQPGMPVESPGPEPSTEIPMDSSTFATTPTEPPPTAELGGIGSTAKAIGIVAVLLALAFVPHFFPLLVVAAVFWQILKRRTSGKPSPQMEALKIFASEVSRSRNRSSKERPLEALRRVERQLKTPPRA